MENGTKILQKIKNFDSFSASEKAIAKIVLKDPKKFTTLSVRQIAKETFTSPTTVMRFCRKICDGGFPEFRIQLAAELFTARETLVSNEEEVLAKKMDDLNTIISRLENYMVESILQTKELINYEMIDQVVNCIVNAKKIHIFGCGTSQKVGEDFYFKLFRIAKNIEIHRSFTDQHIQSMNATNEDCAILLSVSGETKDILAIADTLCKNGVPIITLTSAKDCKLLHYSDYPLFFKTFESYQKVGSISSSVAMQFVLKFIYLAIFNLNYQENTNTMLKANL